ncbi:DJ-1/PfpI family protein [Bacillus sp. 31A1R]|uniref:DJ-1/PfpI family protein n=1 Tax=Robertmurraya mangrovi TaxID=3098077 RepID=A0ABU5ITH2_9BACI|nr:DJ-1/PfpI family protein [Bacillus sp. 31A1R]MDZ5470421.1 DJ-1/PfpI family protein [Bacillus sp. 31A1R]
MKIVIVTFDEFTDLDVFFPWDILNRVKLVGGKTDLEVKLIGTKSSHVSMAGLEIPMSGTIKEANEADAVLFASGKGVQDLYQNEHYLAQFSLDPSRQLIGSMCSGALILAGLGLLKNKKATTYPTVVHQLKELGVDVVKESFVLQGNVATAAGCLAAQELSSWIISSLYNDDMVQLVFDSVQKVR